MNVGIEVFCEGAWRTLCTEDDLIAAEELAEHLRQHGHRCRARFGRLFYSPGRGWGDTPPPQNPQASPGATGGRAFR